MQFIKNHIPFCILAVLLAGNVFVWNAVLSHTDDTLTIAFLDVGQGDSIFIEAPNGNQVLIDGGKNKKVLRSLTRVLPFYDRHIDVIAATHPDADHIGGLFHILGRYAVDAYISTGQKGDTVVYRNIEKRVEEKEVQSITVRTGHIIDLGGGVFIDVLFPDRDVSGWDKNDASLITRLRYGETSVLLTGDASKSIENYLTSIYGDALTSNILKAGHHGSDTSSSHTFLGFVSPETGVVSAGKDNQYGHPDPEVLDRFTALGATVLSTADEGNIIFTSDGRTFTKKYK